MKQIYYGIWQEVYRLAWPLRFLIELSIIVLIVFLVWKIFKKLSKVLCLKRNIVKLVVLLVTEFDGLVGKNTVWAVENDEKISDWGRRVLEQPSVKWESVRRVLKKVLVVIVICIYFFGILPDLPISNVIDSYYMKNLSGVKEFFQKKEAVLSLGHEKYPHLFRIEKKQDVKKKQETVKKKAVSLKLKKIKKKKIVIRKKPSMKANIIAKIKSKDKVIYKYRYRKVGKRYWLRVSLPVKKISGWIDSRYVNKSQLKKILKTKYAS